MRAKLTRAQVVRMAATGAFRAMRRRGWWVNDTFTCAGQAFFIVDPRTGLPRGSIVQRTHTPGQGTGESTGAPA